MQKHPVPVPGRNLRRRWKPRHGSRGRVGSGTGPLFRLRGRPHNAGPSSVRHMPKPRRRMRHLPQATARLFLGRRCGSRPGRPGVRALRFSPRTGSSRVVRNIPQGGGEKGVFDYRLCAAGRGTRLRSRHLRDVLEVRREQTKGNRYPERLSQGGSVRAFGRRGKPPFRGAPLKSVHISTGLRKSAENRKYARSAYSSVMA